MRRSQVTQQGCGGARVHTWASLDSELMLFPLLVPCGFGRGSHLGAGLGPSESLEVGAGLASGCGPGPFAPWEVSAASENLFSCRFLIDTCASEK